MKQNIRGVSMLLRGKAVVSSLDYRDILGNVNAEDAVYMDPPYQGVCGDRDSRYYTGISFDGFTNALSELNRRNIKYAVSYDGRTGTKMFGKRLPAHLELTLIELEAGRSSQATLLGRDAVTVESLYLSAALAREVGAIPYLHKWNPAEQMLLLEPKSRYRKVSKRIS